MEQYKCKVFIVSDPESGVANIVGHIGDYQAAGCIDHLWNEWLIRQGIHSVALLNAIRRIDYGPDVFILFHSYIADVVVVVIRTTAGRLNMQVVMARWVTFVVLACSQVRLLFDQQSLAGPEPPCIIGATGIQFSSPAFSVHVSCSISCSH